MLRIQLPVFMVPNVFHILDKMPVTAGDKIDRAALLEYQFNSERIEERSSTNGRGEISCIHLGKSLNIKQLDIFSNFFELGGHSIKAVQVMIEIQKQTGKEFPLSALFHIQLSKNLLNYYPYKMSFHQTT
jgi:acyl carrier protein